MESVALIRNGKVVGFVSDSAAGVNYTNPNGTKTNLQTKIRNLEKGSINKAEGESFTLTTAEGKAFIKRIEGKSVQNGVPTPTVPIAIESVGDSVNLIHYPYVNSGTTNRGITYVVNDDGTILANGTVTESTLDSYFAFTPTMTLEKGTYFISSGIANESDSLYWFMGFTGDGKEFTRSTRESKIFTLEEKKKVYFQVRVYRTTTVNNLLFKPILVKVNEDGTYPTTYIPYGNGLVFENHNKNLISYPYEDGIRKVSNGITFTVNDDGSVTANGTATASAYFFPSIRTNLKFYLKSGTYRLSGCPNGGSSSKYRISLQGTSASGSAETFFIDYGSGVIGNIPDAAVNRAKQVAIQINSGQTVNNLTFKPMLVEVNEDGTYPTEFEKGKSAITKVDIEPLRSIGDVKDELIFEDGKYKVIRRIKEIDLKEFNYEYFGTYASHNLFYLKTALVDADFTKSDTVISRCEGYISTEDSKATSMINYGSRVRRTDGRLYFNNDDYNSADAFNAFMQSKSMKFDYILAIPIIEELTAEQAIALLSIPTYDEQTHIDYLNYVKPMTSLEYAMSRESALTLIEYIDFLNGKKSVDDAYDITYKDTNVGNELDALKQNIVNLIIDNTHTIDVDNKQRGILASAGQTFTPTQNGILCVMAQANASGKGSYMVLFDGNARLVELVMTNAWEECGLSVPVYKGVTYSCYAITNIGSIDVRFYPFKNI